MRMTGGLEAQQQLYRQADNLTARSRSWSSSYRAFRIQVPLCLHPRLEGSAAFLTGNGQGECRMIASKLFTSSLLLISALP